MLHYIPLAEIYVAVATQYTPNFFCFGPPCKLGGKKEKEESWLLHVPNWSTQRHCSQHIACSAEYQAPLHS